MKYQPVNKEQDQPKQQPIKITKHIIYKQCQYTTHKLIQTLQSQITSSLLLQQLMYYNIFYSIIFVYLYFASQIFRFLYMNMQYGVPVRLILLAIFSLLQYFRLTNGYYGNLKQSFPQILAFFFLTLFTLSDQIICLVLLPAMPMEWSLLFYGIIFHGIELIVCLFAMKRLTAAQTALFFWRNPMSKIKLRYKKRLN